MNKSDTKELESAKRTGKLLLGKLTSTVATSVLYGIFVLLFIVSTYNVFHRRQAKSRVIWAMFIATLISFLLATLDWAQEIAIFVFYIQMLFLSPQDSVQIEIKMLELSRVVLWIVFALQIINDSIVAWRAWVLRLECRRWVMIGPFMLLIGTFACACALMGLTVSRTSYLAFWSSATGTSHNFIYAAFSLSAACNIFSTLLIGERLWVSRKAWGYGAGSRWSNAQKILLMLVECGAFYAAFQISIAFFLSKSPSAGTSMGFTVTSLWAVYVQITAMFPTSMMVMVHRKQCFSGDE